MSTTTALPINGSIRSMPCCFTPETGVISELDSQNTADVGCPWTPLAVAVVV